MFPRKRLPLSPSPGREQPTQPLGSVASEHAYGEISESSSGGPWTIAFYKVIITAAPARKEGIQMLRENDLGK